MYRFYYHYRRFDNRLSVHFRGKCIPCDNVDCRVPCKSKWNKRQPFLVMQGFCSDIELNNGTMLIK